MIPNLAAVNSRSAWQDTGHFTLVHQDGVWKLVAYQRTVTPTPVPPTRDPNAPPLAPPDSADLVSI